MDCYGSCHFQDDDSSKKGCFKLNLKKRVIHIYIHLFIRKVDNMNGIHSSKVSIVKIHKNRSLKSVAFMAD